MSRRDDCKASLALSHELYALCDMYGLEGEESLKALVSTAARIMCQDAPDRQTATDWRDLFSGALWIAVQDADAGGQAVWSHQRMH